MADEPKPEVHNIEALQKSLEKQISELRREIAKVSKSVAVHSDQLIGDARNLATEALEAAAMRAAGATRQLRTQARVVSEVAKENPRTTTAVIGLAGCIGFLIGVAVATSLRSDSRRSWH